VKISVIIATYNRANLLDDCLEQLVRQPFHHDDEIVVVDNGSTDGTASVIAGYRERSPIVLRHLEERRPGKSHALSLATQMAKGDVFVFIDDDVSVEPNWLDEIRTAMASSRADLLGGPIVPRWERPRPGWLNLDAPGGYGRLAAPLGLLDYGSDRSALGGRTLLGANMAVRADVLRQVGGFAPHLGKLRGTLLSGEDHDFCRRVEAAGFTALYDPRPRVRHWVPSERAQVRYVLRWFFWSGITVSALDESEARPMRSVFGLPAYLVRRGMTSTLGTLGALVVGRTAVALDRAIDVAFAAGYAAKRWGAVSLDPPAAQPARSVAA
jgi:glycosyltransferase involved in cell wall biosynthesis